MPLDAPVITTSDVAHDAPALLRQLTAWMQQQQPPWLHAEVARRMGERLPLFKQQPARVLQWWPTSGGGDSLLRQTYPHAALTCVEPEGLHRVRPLNANPERTAWARWWRRVTQPEAMQQPRHAVSDHAVAPDSCELIWANMALHAAPDRRQMVEGWHQALAVGGLVMFSTLGPDTLRELRSLYRDQRWGPCAAGLVDMHDVGDDLVRAGFADPVMDQEQLTLHWADANTMLAELRTLGRNTAPTRFQGLRTPRWRQTMDLHLLRRAADQRITLTFEVIYGHAFKVKRGSSSIAVDELRSTLPSRRRAAR